MTVFTSLLLLIIAGCTWRETISTCVLDSDYGFTLNCAFKKSGLFRVRNLGGVGGYIGLGISVGDELGFPNSLSNVESISKRRSVQTGRGNFIAIENGGNGISQRDGSIPPFKPLPGGPRPMAQQPEHQRLVVQQNLTALKTIPAPSLTKMHEAAMYQQQQQKLAMQQQQRIQHEVKLRQQQRIQQETLALQMLKQQQEANIRQKLAQQSLKRPSLGLQTKRVQSMVVSDSGAVYRPELPNIIAAIPPADSILNVNKMSNSKPVAGVLVSENGLPAFIAMPQSTAQLTDRIGSSPILLEDSVNDVSKDSFVQLPLPNEQMAQSVNEMTLQSLNPGDAVAEPLTVNSVTRSNANETPSLSSSSSLRPIQGLDGMSLKALAEASNITLEALEAAILLRQQQLMERQQGPQTTTTTTTTQSPIKSHTNSGTTKVMNAPREYYPMNYDKNFDDNFASRVDLPDTSFYCGDQKHFPGLYADEDLGCMVFHVCALTDDGLIMKSFLCPESTLFDQTILKCNWWFYVDCKASKSLYDSNIPISKSYQLMKALAFFSAYKNHDNSTAPITEVDDANADS